MDKTMEMKEFAAKVQADVAAMLEKETQVREVLKLNGIRLYGLTVIDPDKNTSPTIYLEPFYHRFLESGNWPLTIVEISEAYQHNTLNEPFNADWFMDFNQVKGKICYRLINYDANRELLEHIPHSRFLDLAKIFYVQYQLKSVGMGTISIYNTHLEIWGISADELAAVAEANTPLLLNARFTSLDNTLAEIIGSPEFLHQKPESAPKDACPFFVLTNTLQSNGAAAICYQDTLKNFSGRTGKDTIILPSSIHETILLPLKESIDFAFLKRMVHSVNITQVNPEEFLSDSVYIYRRSTGQIEIA